MPLHKAGTAVPPARDPIRPYTCLPLKDSFAGALCSRRLNVLRPSNDLRVKWRSSFNLSRWAFSVDFLVGLSRVCGGRKFFGRSMTRHQAGSRGRETYRCRHEAPSKKGDAGEAPRSSSPQKGTRSKAVNFDLTDNIDANRRAPTRSQRRPRDHSDAMTPSVDLAAIAASMALQDRGAPFDSVATPATPVALKAHRERWASRN